MDHLFSVRDAFDHPVTRWVVVAIAGCILVAPLLLFILDRFGHISETTRRDAWTRYRTWLWLAPFILFGVLLCPLSAMVFITAFSLLCYREFARATGLFREPMLSALVVVAILALCFASVDHWYNFFTAIPALAIALIFGLAVLQDRPTGYLQRTSLATVGLLLFGAGLGHLGYIANAENYRPILCTILLSTQLSDIAGFAFGKSLGRRHLFPRTSPNKTLAGHIGAFIIVAPLASWLVHETYAPDRIISWPICIGFGVIVGIGAQLGDLVLSSIKRDLGLKDLAVMLPGHGGFTDRFNSVLLVAPSAFHYFGYFVGFGLDRTPRVLTGHE